jgi:SWI/SNF-related matrix-associated actin-dependent regulator of chromatin subfamily A-like protein 1
VQTFYTLQKFKYVRIDGKTTAEQRGLFCNRFQSDSDVKIAILSITAANSGINLTAASLVVFAELFWNPGVRFLCFRAVEL